MNIIDLTCKDSSYVQFCFEESLDPKEVYGGVAMINHYHNVKVITTAVMDDLMEDLETHRDAVFIVDYESFLLTYRREIYLACRVSDSCTLRGINTISGGGILVNPYLADRLENGVRVSSFLDWALGQ